MLAVHKEDKDRSHTAALTASGFGKVLGSIQGLQKRLGDFSYGEVSIAEAKVKLLVKQLSALRDNIGTIVRLKHAAGETNRRIRNLPEENFHLVGPDNLEKHPQLHAIIKASNLIRARGHLKAAFNTADNLAANMITNASVVVPLMPQDPSVHAKTKLVPRTEIKPSVVEGIATKNAPPSDVAAHKPTAPHEMTFDRADEASLAKEMESSSGASSQPTFPSKVDTPVHHTTDLTFDFDEGPISSEASPARIDFEFPAETLSVEETPLAKSSIKTLRQPKHPANAEARPAPRAQLYEVEEKPPLSTQTRIAKKSSGKKALTNLEESRALVPTTYDFDHRLLEAVIKNYGDFSASTNLPANIDSKATNVPAVDKPTAHKAPHFNTPEPGPRDGTNQKKAGDLDRQLKKIIKDYGEYDLYQRQSVFNLKTGGIAVFAVLGLVLGGLYWFGGAPSNEPLPSSRWVAQPTTPELPTSIETTKSAKTSVSRDEQPADSNAVMDPTGPAPVTKQTP